MYNCHITVPTKPTTTTTRAPLTACVDIFKHPVFWNITIQISTIHSRVNWKLDLLFWTHSYLSYSLAISARSGKKKTRTIATKTGWYGIAPKLATSAMEYPVGTSGRTASPWKNNDSAKNDTWNIFVQKPAECAEQEYRVYPFLCRCVLLSLEKRIVHPSVCPPWITFKSVLDSFSAPSHTFSAQISCGNTKKQVEQSSDNRCVLWRTARVLVNALYTIKEWNATFCTSSFLGSDVLSSCSSTVFNFTFRLHYPWGHLSSMVVTSQHSLEFGCHLWRQSKTIGHWSIPFICRLVKTQDDIKSDKRAGNFDCDGNVHQTLRPLHLDRGHYITINDLLCRY